MPSLVPNRRRLEVPHGSQAATASEYQATALPRSATPTTGGATISAAIAKKAGEASLSAAVGLLNAAIDPAGWKTVTDADPCTLKVLVGRTPAPTFAETMEYRVPSIFTHIRSDLGSFGINLCGAARHMR